MALSAAVAVLSAYGSAVRGWLDDTGRPETGRLLDAAALTVKWT
jgi:hypothetical protein